MFLRASFSFFLIFALNVANIKASPKNLGRIVNGEDQPINGRPFQAVIFPNETICGGSILNKDWIVTAAHCTEDLPKELIVYAVGVQDIRQIQEYLKISELVQHPFYNTKTKDNDIALIKVAISITFSPTVQPIDIQMTVPKDDTAVIASGYGDPIEDSEDPTFVLKSVEIKIVNFITCNGNFGHSLTNNMFCAGVPEYDKDTCQGDSGGPLTYDGKLLGIVSFGYGCAKEDPGVYTKVLNYVPWMSKSTGIQF